MHPIIKFTARNIGLIVLGACIVYGAGDICSHIDKLRHAEQARLDAFEQKLDTANALNAKLQMVAAAVPAWQLVPPKPMVVADDGFRPGRKPVVPGVRR